MADRGQQQHQRHRQGFAHDFTLFDLTVSASLRLMRRATDQQ
jgi:hypothetical protein